MLFLYPIQTVFRLPKGEAHGQSRRNIRAKRAHIFCPVYGFAHPSEASGGAGKEIAESGKLQGQAVENISVEVFPEEFSAVE